MSGVYYTDIQYSSGGFLIFHLGSQWAFGVGIYLCVIQMYTQPTVFSGHLNAHAKNGPEWPMGKLSSTWAVLYMNVRFI